MFSLGLRGFLFRPLALDVCVEAYFMLNQLFSFLLTLVIICYDFFVVLGKAMFVLS